MNAANARVAALTVSELLRGKQQGEKGVKITPHPPTPPPPPLKG